MHGVHSLGATRSLFLLMSPSSSVFAGLDSCSFVILTLGIMWMSTLMSWPCCMTLLPETLLLLHRHHYIVHHGPRSRRRLVRMQASAISLCLLSGSFSFSLLLLTLLITETVNLSATYILLSLLFFTAHLRLERKSLLQTRLYYERSTNVDSLSLCPGPAFHSTAASHLRTQMSPLLLTINAQSTNQRLAALFPPSHSISHYYTNLFSTRKSI